MVEGQTDISLLGNLAVCRGDVAPSVVDVAPHHVVGEVRLQDDVFGVHLNLKTKEREAKAPPKISKRGDKQCISQRDGTEKGVWAQN